MNPLFVRGRKLFLLVFAGLLIIALGYVAVRAGPLAPVRVTVTTVQQDRIAPALFGIGAVEARYSYKIGPTAAGRVLRVNVHVGDRVSAGQLVAEIDPVDLDERILSQQAALRRARAAVSVAKAQVADAAARRTYAESQARRYDHLVQLRFVSEESAESKRQDRHVADAAFAAAAANVDALTEDVARMAADVDVLMRQRANLRLVAPVDGQVVARAAEPGTTLIAGEAVVEIIDPGSLWLNVRFDQSRTSGLRPGLPASVTLRSGADRTIAGHVVRLEPLADTVTEELLAKVAFDRPSHPLPPVGELAEVTVALPEIAVAAVIPNAALKQVDGTTGVWVAKDDAVRFAAVRTGRSDLQGRVEILQGLEAKDRVIVYSERQISRRSRIQIVDRLTGRDYD